MKTTASMAATITPTVDTSSTIMNPDDDPGVREARAAFDEALRRESEADTRRQHSAALLNPYSYDPPAELADERLAAIEHQRDVVIEAACATRQRKETEAAWRAARERARDRVRSACRERKRELVRSLAGILEQAAAVNRELAVVEDRERTLTGDWHLDGFAWPELSDESPLQGSKLLDWKCAAVAAKLLDK